MVIMQNSVWRSRTDGSKHKVVEIDKESMTVVTWGVTPPHSGAFGLVGGRFLNVPIPGESWYGDADQFIKDFHPCFVK